MSSKRLKRVTQFWIVLYLGQTEVKINPIGTMNERKIFQLAINLLFVITTVLNLQSMQFKNSTRASPRSHAGRASHMLTFPSHETHSSCAQSINVVVK